ncbi:hypothetical protein LOTGIDRAFT_183168 [Lottia gigantea]|uniref:Chitin-binding type-4 domain-containing protein n=1 Tax=Lottia gigantea TaxID=225164 RepID=V4BKR2_LOTGI|nr:hypothetical protein LOTGIDRAFT_183168 [Lottia gigantea]ESO89174.1 hypothetical protein LOTGIDRAFT_183168 [Lottia gigantea]
MLLYAMINGANGHGRLLDPPSRSSMWRFGFKNPPNYDDHQLFCGGVSIQWGQNDGKCGLCGDAWQGPRHNEPAGKYANGIIVKKYKVGQVITARVELTATHKGYFQFKLCSNDNPYKNITQECLDSHVLEVVDTGTTQFPAPTTNGNVTVKLKLPKDVKCTACVFQWKYNSGNSWGTCKNGQGGIGCGAQEQFYGCADIAIGYPDIVIGKTLEKRPWYFESPDSDWHWGIVGRVNNTFISAGTNIMCSGFILTVMFLVSTIVFRLL